MGLLSTIRVGASPSARRGDHFLDWRLFFTTLWLIFLAELGDKTQLTTIAMSAQAEKPWSVFWGAAIALTLTSLLGMLVGHFIADLVPARLVHMGAGVLFVILGVLLILGRV